MKGEAEAFAVEAKAKAEAEQMAKKADAWKDYQDAAMVDMILETLPKVLLYDFCQSTVKHVYREHAYNDSTPTAKRFSFPVTWLHVVNLMDITNYSYNKAKLHIPVTLLKACFTVHGLQKTSVIVVSIWDSCHSDQIFLIFTQKFNQIKIRIVH